MKGRDIIKAVLRETGVCADDFFSRRRTRPLIEARRIAILQLRGAGFSYEQTGRLIGRCHDTIRYWLKPDHRAYRMERNARYWHTHKRIRQSDRFTEAAE